MNNFIFRFLFIALFVIFSLHANARPITSQDQGYAVEEVVQEASINADGTMHTHFISKYKILTEEGTRTFTVYRIPFNANTQKVTVVKIEVRNPDGVNVINPKNIEEKSLFGGYSGYDETRTKIIPLPTIKVGSEIYVEYNYDVFHPPFAGVISSRFMLSYGSDVGDFSVKLTVPTTATLKLYDPSGLFEKVALNQKSGSKTVFSIVIKNLNGISAILEDNAMPPEKKLSWVDVTNLKTFDEAGVIATKGFDKELAQPLPERLKALFGEKPTEALDASLAQKRMTEILKAISDNFRYFGDWRSVDGGYIPRSLADIVLTGYGDCKDFATLTVSAARYLGLDADVILTYRDENPYQLATVPNLSIYNHAIARVKIPGTENFWWVDATNPIPNIGLIPNDIADRTALVLGKAPGKADIMRDDDKQSQETVVITYDASVSPNIKYDASIHLSGHVGWEVKSQLLGRSQKQIEEYTISLLGIPNYDAKDFKLIKSEMPNEYPYAVDFQFQVTQANGIGRSGDLKILPVLTFGEQHHSIMNVLTTERTSDLSLDTLKRVTVTQKITSGTYNEIVGAPQGCQIKSPWLDYERKVAATPDFQIVDDYTVHKYRVTIDELKSPEFATLQKELRDCLLGIRVVVR